MINHENDDLKIAINHGDVEIRTLDLIQNLSLTDKCHSNFTPAHLLIGKVVALTLLLFKVCEK